MTYWMSLVRKNLDILEYGLNLSIQMKCNRYKH